MLDSFVAPGAPRRDEVPAGFGGLTMAGLVVMPMPRACSVGGAAAAGERERRSDDGGARFGVRDAHVTTG